MLAWVKQPTLRVAASKICHVVAHSAKWRTNVKIQLIPNKPPLYVYLHIAFSNAATDDLKCKQNILINQLIHSHSTWLSYIFKLNLFSL